MNKIVIATMEHRVPNVCTYWRIQWPSTPFKWGKAYLATTYPNSDLIYLQTAAHRRPVSPLQGRKIMPIVREAINRATHHE